MLGGEQASNLDVRGGAGEADLVALKGAEDVGGLALLDVQGHP